jgi:ATP-dependent Clp protease ATP-binding subunit ClpA
MEIKEINNLLDVSMKFSMELESVLNYSKTILAEELPTLNIDIDYFMLAILSHKKNFLYSYLDNKLMTSSMEAITNTLYQVVSTRALSAVKPNRKPIESSQLNDIFSVAKQEALSLKDSEITTYHVFLAILKDTDESNKIKKVFNNG